MLSSVNPGMDVRSTRVCIPPLGMLWRWDFYDTLDAAVAHRETSPQPSHPHATPSQRLGATIRQYRKQRGLTQRALAARLGVHYMYMSKIERGHHTVGVLLLLGLAQALDIPPAHLLAPLETGAASQARGTQEATAAAPSALHRDEASRVLQRLGAMIRHARQDQRLSQPALADKTGLDVSYLSNIERGQRNVSVLVVVRLAHALGLSVAQLLDPVSRGSSSCASPTPPDL